MLRNLLLVLFFTFSAITALADGLRVGISPDYPPLAYKQEGRIVGIEADNVRAVSEIIGQKMTLVEMPFETACLPRVLTYPIQVPGILLIGIP